MGGGFDILLMLIVEWIKFLGIWVYCWNFVDEIWWVYDINFWFRWLLRWFLFVVGIGGDEVIKGLMENIWNFWFMIFVVVVVIFY